jgi:hypothetical protein
MIGTLAEIQRRSLEAAAAIVDRLVSSVDGRAGDEGPEPAAPDTATEPAATTEALIDGWSQLWRDSVTGLAAVVSDPASPAAGGLQVDGPERPAALRVEVDPHGVGELDVWVHNPTERGLAGLRVHCSRPRAHDGTELEESCLGADPAEFELPARSSRGIRLTVKAPLAPAGTFRAILLVEGLPEQWLPIEICIPAPLPRPPDLP